MSGPQEHPWEIRVFHAGVDSDTEPEFIAPKSGSAFDSCNTRGNSADGDSGAREKINGEIVLYANIDNNCYDGDDLPFGNGVICIGSSKINGNHFEVWADENVVEPPYMRINGVVVAKSFDLPFLATHPLQLDKNESCVGGEVYMTDYNTPPLFFSIKSLMENGGMINGVDCSGRYFENFNVLEQLLMGGKGLDHPVFMRLTGSQDSMDNVFVREGMTGMPVGYYMYSYRFVNEGGDGTGWSMPTPQIPVVPQVSENCNNSYPYSQTVGGDSIPTVSTQYGVHLRLRINNNLNFDRIEIRRDQWNGSEADLPISEIAGLIQLEPGQFGVLDILDLYGYEGTLTDLEAAAVMNAVSRAKAIRYFNKRVYLANIEYASRVVDEDEYEIEPETFNGANLFPIMHKMGKAGHADPWNVTYKKHYMSNEKFDFAIMFWDENGGMSFSNDIDALNSFQFPNRRDPVESPSDISSYWGLVDAARHDGTLGDTYEVFDLENAVAKSNYCDVFNILDNGSKQATTMNYGELGFCDNLPTDLFFQVTANGQGFKPMRPTGSGDSNCGGSDYRVTLNIGDVDPSTLGDIEMGYAPVGFGPDYYARGVALNKLASWPSWAKAFSVVRTRPAKKVVAQGIAHYALLKGGVLPWQNMSKEKDKFWCYFPDLDSEIGLDPLIAEDINNYPGNYRVQFVSPLGFFTEAYNVFHRSNLIGNGIGDQGPRHVELATYARIIKEKINPVSGFATMNHFDNYGMGLQNSPPDERYVGYGHWRTDSNQTAGPFANGAGGDQEFGIDLFTPQSVVNGRGEYFVMRTDQDIHNHGTSVNDGGTYGMRAPMKDWHEPLYIINIIRVEAEISTQNIQQYVNTGNYQKFESIIGISDGGQEQSYELVDERWEDCIPALGTINSSFAATNEYLLLRDRYIFVKNTFGEHKRWINVTYKDQVDIDAILLAIDTDGFATINDYDGDYQVYGVYKHTEEYVGTAPKFSIVFSVLNSNYSLNSQRPQTTEEILVKYDNRIPVHIFGGDSYVGEAVWCPLDLKMNRNGAPDTDGDNFYFNVGFPYLRYNINERVMIPRSTQSFLNGDIIQDENTLQFKHPNGLIQNAKIRQLLNMFCCESRVNLCFGYGNNGSALNSNRHVFPTKQYVMRPHKWNQAAGDNYGDWESQNHLQPGYADEYGPEWQWWGYGGFRFRPITNKKFSKKAMTSTMLTSAPEVGFTEQNLFCTRTIWSAEKLVNIQNSPGAQTFNDLNYYDLPDKNGEIKLLWNGLSEKGQNLYAFTETGVALMLTDKRLLNDASGAALGEIGSEIAGVVKHIWINQSVGMTDEMWRGFAEWDNVGWWPTKTGVFQIKNNTIEDISRNEYFNRLHPILQDLAPGYRDNIEGGFDIYTREFLLSFKKRGAGLYSHRPANIDETYASVVDQEQNPDIDSAFYEYGLNFNVLEDMVLNVRTDYDTGDDYHVVIGGTAHVLLSKQMYFSVDADSPNAVKVTYRDYNANGNEFLTMLVSQGTCIRFTPYTLTTDEGGYYSPYGDAVYFTATVVVLDGLAEQWENDGCQTFLYSMARSKWQGRTSHEFDEYLSDENRHFGMKNGETYELNKGYVINGVTLEASFVGSCIGKQPWDKEFVRMRINSNVKPSSVKFYLNREDVDIDNELCEVTGDEIKSRYGYEFNIPRAFAERHRLQGRILFYKIIHNLAEDFKVIDVQTQHKNLK